MSVVDRMRGTARTEAGHDASVFAARVDALGRFLDAADGRVPPARLAASWRVQAGGRSCHVLKVCPGLRPAAA